MQISMRLKFPLSADPSPKCFPISRFGLGKCSEPAH